MITASENFKKFISMHYNIPFLFSAIAEQYASSAEHSKDVLISLTSDSMNAIDRSKKFVFVNEDGKTLWGVLGEAFDAFNNEEDVVINCTTKTPTGLDTTVMTGIDSVVECISNEYMENASYSELYSVLGSTGENEVIDIQKLLSRLKLKLKSDFIPASVSELIYSFSGLTPREAMTVVASTATTPDTLTWNFSDYNSSPTNVFISVITGMFDDITKGMQGLFDKITSMKDLMNAILETGKALVTNLVNLIFPGLSSDYEVTKDCNLSGIDVPVFSIKCASLLYLDSLIKHAMSGTGYGKFRATLGPAEDPAGLMGSTAHTMMMPMAFDYSVIAQVLEEGNDPEPMRKIMSELSKTGMIVSVFGPLVIAIVVPNFTHGYNVTPTTPVNMAVYLSTYRFHANMEFSSFFVENNPIEINSNDDFAKVLSTIANNTRSLTSLPIWNNPDNYQDYLDFLFETLFDFGSAIPNTLSAQDFVHEIKYKDLLCSNDSHFALITGEIMDRNEKFLAFWRILALFYLSISSPGVVLNTNVAKGYHYSIMSGNVEIYQFGTINSVQDLPSFWYPYETASSPKFSIHVQTLSEIMSEWKSAVYKVLVAAAAVVVATKVSKALKYHRAQSAGLQRQLEDMYAIGYTPSQVKPLIKKLRRSNIVSKVLGGINPINALSAIDLNQGTNNSATLAEISAKIS